MKKQNLRRFRWRWILGAVALLAALVLTYKPDWGFVAAESVSALGTSAPRGEKNASALSLEAWSLDALEADSRVTVNQSLLLIDESYPLAEDFTPDLVSLDEDTQANRVLEDAYASLKEAVQEQYDKPLYIRSAYRTAEEQAEEEQENSAVAAGVGESEHQAGLALDVYVPGYAGSALIKTEAGQYVNRSCWEYGFIIRYPYYGEAETGIPYEPWHLRYVGAPHAEYIMKNHLTLEEYITGLTPGVWYECGGSLVSRQSLDAPELPADFSSAVVSPDNTGYLVVTVQL